MNSREKIMEMVKDGTLSVEEGLRLLDAIEESEKRAEKEAQHQAALFEEQVNNGLATEGRVKFSTFSERWFQDYAAAQLRPRTLERYRDLMKRIEPEIGHLYLDKIRPGHLITLPKAGASAKGHPLPRQNRHQSLSESTGADPKGAG